jgi:bacterioferritin-associated ferredoxin
MIAQVKRHEFTGVDWQRMSDANGEECGRCGVALLRRERNYCTRCLELARQVVCGSSPRAALVRV